VKIIELINKDSVKKLVSSITKKDDDKKAAIDIDDNIVTEG
jgi:hypothetical protein